MRCAACRRVVPVPENGMKSSRMENLDPRQALSSSKTWTKIVGTQRGVEVSYDKRMSGRKWR